MFRELIGAISTVVKYKYKNKKPTHEEEWAEREKKINDLIEGGDPDLISDMFERMRRKISGSSKR